MAGFLIVVGVTGSLLAFLPELDHLIAPGLFPGPHPGVELDPAALARRAEALAPGVRANTVYLGYIGTAQVGVEAHPGAVPVDYDQIYLDAVTGEELGRIRRSGLPSSPGEIMPYVFRLHYELALGETGLWILGIIALAWTFDCFIAIYLTLPAATDRSQKSFLARWKPAWLIKPRGVYRFNFDLHRASGLWLSAALFIFAWSSVFWDLNGFYTRATNLLFEYRPPEWALPAPPARDGGQEPLSWEEAQAIARRHMDAQAETFSFAVERPLALYLLRHKGLFEYRVRSSRDIGDRYGSTSLYFDAHTGELKKIDIPTGQRVGNTLTSWLVALHMANLFGLPYRIFVGILGIAICILSITGVYIWWKKRGARLQHALGPARRSER